MKSFVSFLVYWYVVGLALLPADPNPLAGNWHGQARISIAPVMTELKLLIDSDGTISGSYTCTKSPAGTVSGTVSGGGKMKMTLSSSGSWGVLIGYIRLNGQTIDQNDIDFQYVKAYHPSRKIRLRLTKSS